MNLPLSPRKDPRRTHARWSPPPPAGPDVSPQATDGVVATESGWPEAMEEQAWARALRTACLTVAHTPEHEVSSTHVVITLTGSTVQAADLLAYCCWLARPYGLRAGVVRFAPPTFTVRFSHPGTDGGAA